MTGSRIKIGGLQQALNKLQQADAARRAADSHKILDPSSIARGKISGGRLLYTTLGGQPRQLTAADLQAFKRSAANLGQQYRAGATIGEVLRASLPEDIARAKAEILTAAPVRLRDGRVEFMVNASGKYDGPKRHIVTLLFADYGAALAQPSTPLQAAAWMAREGHVKWDCTCGRHTFWYRYISTVIGANAGRAESGLPKVRNPELRGMGCKHVLRVMNDARDSVFIRRRLADMVKADRDRLDKPARSPKAPQTIRVTQQQADQITARSRRIVVSSNARRGAKLPPPASAADIQAALQAFSGKRDTNSIAVTRALQNLLAAQQKAARP